jgi:hypothetical protein
MEEGRHVDLHGAFGEAQVPGNLLVGAALYQEMENLCLAAGQGHRVPRL